MSYVRGFWLMSIIATVCQAFVIFLLSLTLGYLFYLIFQTIIVLIFIIIGAYVAIEELLKVLSLFFSHLIYASHLKSGEILRPLFLFFFLINFVTCAHGISYLWFAIESRRDLESHESINKTHALCRRRQVL